MSEVKSRLSTLDRALDVLEIVEEASCPVTMTEVARQLGEPRPIIFRVLQTYEARGYVRRRSDDKRYTHTGRSTGTGAIRRAVMVLQSLSSFTLDGATAEELSIRTGLDTLAVEDVLAPLCQTGLIKRDEMSQRWQLTYALMEIARPLLAGDNLVPVVRPLLERLVAQTGETVSLFQYAGDQQVVTAVVPSPHPVRYVLGVGESFPLYLGAAGKATLAALPDAEVKRLLDCGPVQQITDFKVDFQRLRKEIAMIRRLGYAVSAGERVEGASAVAATISDSAGCPRATISLLMPSFRATEQGLRELGETLAGQVRTLLLPAR